MCHQDGAGNKFATRDVNVFILGHDKKPLVSLPKGKGTRLTILQEQERLYKAQAAA